MSGITGAGQPSEGVVRNSVLSFVAPAQPIQPITEGLGAPASASDTPNEQLSQADRLVPAGLKALCEACSKLYPDQPNPLQVTTRLKYWLGGQEPLDYISMYWNPGKPEENIPPHWHYISFGLSDLHGDGRVHPPPDRVVSSLGSAPSGYGLELTLRLAVETDSTTGPPLWPAALLQALARYIFTTGNKFCAGDHISWHAALDAGSDSRVRHLLVADDTLLPTVKTAHGTVAFLQMVGCTGRELRAAQRGSGFDVLKLISEDPSCGGAWLVTRVRRRRSARGVRTRVSNAPAHLAGVSARVHWLHWTPPNTEDQPASPSSLTPRVEQQIKETLQRGLSTMSTDRTGPEGHMSTDSFEMSSMERALPSISDSMQGSWREDSVEYLDGVHLMFNAEAASLLPLAIHGRVSHGRHFTWRWSSRTVTVVGAGVTGALPTAQRPYATRGTWLQVLIPKELIQDMSKQVSSLARLAETDSESDSDGESEKTDPPSLPLTLTWPKYGLKISVVHDHEIL